MPIVKIDYSILHFWIPWFCLWFFVLNVWNMIDCMGCCLGSCSFFSSWKISTSSNDLKWSWLFITNWNLRYRWFYFVPICYSLTIMARWKSVLIAIIFWGIATVAPKQHGVFFHTVWKITLNLERWYFLHFDISLDKNSSAMTVPKSPPVRIFFDVSSCIKVK